MTNPANPSYAIWRHGRPWLFTVTAYGEEAPYEWQLRRGLLEMAENGAKHERTLISSSLYPRPLLDEALTLLDGLMRPSVGYRSPGRIPPEAGFERAFVLTNIGTKLSYAIVPSATGRFRLFRRVDPDRRWEGVLTEMRFLTLADMIYRFLAVP